MTLLTERLPISEITAKTSERFTAFRNHLEQKYSHFRTPVPAPDIVNYVVFSQEPAATQQREQSEKRFWSAIAEKKSNDPVGLVVAGGGMAGIASAVTLEELDKNGIIDTIDVISADSAGALNAAYLLGGKTDRRSEIYLDLAQNGFINSRRRKLQFRSMDLKLLMDFMKSDEGIDPERIRSHKTKLLIGLTNGQGEKRHVDAQTLSDTEIFSAIHASAAAPFVYNEGVKVNNILRADGGLTGVSIKVLRDRGIKNIGVLLNEPLTVIPSLGRVPLAENILLRTTMRQAKYPRGVENATIGRTQLFQRSFEPLNDPDVNFTIMAPTEQIPLLATNMTQLKRVQESTKELTEKKLAEHGLLKKEPTIILQFS